LAAAEATKFITPSEPFCAICWPLRGKYSVKPAPPEERPPDARVLGVEVLRELGRRARALGVHDRDDRQRRQLAAVVVGGDLGVVPVGDLVGEDLGEREAGQPQVAHELPPTLTWYGNAVPPATIGRYAYARPCEVSVAGHRVDALVADVADREVGRQEARSPCAPGPNRSR
jgi:hypothetical protein